MLAWIGLNRFGINYWVVLVLAPLVVGAFGVLIERTLLRAPVQARSDLRPAADLRPDADRSKACSATTSASRASPIRCRSCCRRHQPRLHGPAQLPRLGRGGVAGRLPRHLVPDRAHAARRLPARRHREPAAGAGLRHQRAADGHADLRLRRGAGRACRRAGGAGDPGHAADGLQPDHRGVRGGRDRRHGLDPRLDPDRPRRSA